MTKWWIYSVKLKEMKKVNPLVKTSRIANGKSKHSRHELTEDGEQSRAVRFQRRNQDVDDIINSYDEDELDYAELRRLLK